jgi:hypothetical protein
MNMVDVFGKKVWRAGLGLLVIGTLAACDPVPMGDASCKSALACEVIELTAKDMRSDIGKDFGGGVVLRNAHALGQTLIVDMSLPLSSEAFQEPAGQEIIKDIGKHFAGGFCEGEYAREFFKLGNTLRTRGFSKDNKLVADQIIRSCGGR